MEVELDKTKEELLQTTQKLEEKEKALLTAELEVNLVLKSSEGQMYLISG